MNRPESDKDHGVHPGRTVTLAAALLSARTELQREQPPASVQQAMSAAWPALQARTATPLPTTGHFDKLRANGLAGLPRANGLPGVPGARGAHPFGLSLSKPWRWATGLTACLGVLLACLLLLLLVPAAAPGGGGAGEIHAAPSGFVPLVPAAQLAAASRQPSTAWLVAAEMPRDRLAALGLPFDPARAGESVRTELLVNPAGEVLALRVLH